MEDDDEFYLKFEKWIEDKKPKIIKYLKKNMWIFLGIFIALLVILIFWFFYGYINRLEWHRY